VPYFIIFQAIDKDALTLIHHTPFFNAGIRRLPFSYDVSPLLSVSIPPSAFPVLRISVHAP
jgi:hypothetical protein